MISLIRLAAGMIDNTQYTLCMVLASICILRPARPSISCAMSCDCPPPPCLVHASCSYCSHRGCVSNNWVMEDAPNWKDFKAWKATYVVSPAVLRCRCMTTYTSAWRPPALGRPPNLLLVSSTSRVYSKDKRSPQVMMWAKCVASKGPALHPPAEPTS